MLVLLAPFALAAPVCPASIAELTAAVSDAERAFVDLDGAGLDRSLGDAVAELACSEQPVPPALAARLHRAQALRAFVAGDEAGARRALYAARVLDPVGDYPVGVVPADHPLHALLVNAVLGAPPSMAAPAPAAGTIWFDGRASLDRPSDRPTVFQRTDPKGEVVDGAWLPPDAALPPYPLPGEATKERHTSLALAVAGGASLVAGGVTYGLAGVSHARFEDPATPRDEVGPAYDRTNALVYTSAGFAMLATAGVLGAVLVGQW